MDGKLVDFQWENQEFHKSATTWEISYSPLLHNDTGFRPIVDQFGVVVGYAGRCSRDEFWINKGPQRLTDDNNLVCDDVRVLYLPNITSRKKDFLRTNGYQPFFGITGVDIMLDIDGNVLHYSADVPGVESSGFWAELILGMGAGFTFSILKSGFKSIVKRTTTGGGVGLGKVLATRLARRFTRLKGKVILYHGTTTAGKKSILSKGIVVNAGSGTTDDFSIGFYMSLDSNVGKQASKARRGVKAADTDAIVKAHIDGSKLGKVVDVRVGGMHRKAWDDFLDQPVYSGSPMKQADVYLSNNGMGRGGIFENFLKKEGLESADIIVGPLGDKLTTGLVSIPGVSNQVVIRSRNAIRAVQKILE